MNEARRRRASAGGLCPPVTLGGEHVEAERRHGVTQGRAPLNKTFPLDVDGHAGYSVHTTAAAVGDVSQFFKLKVCHSRKRIFHNQL